MFVHIMVNQLRGRLIYPLYYDMISLASLIITVVVFHLLFGFAEKLIIFWEFKIRNSIWITNCKSLDNRDDPTVFCQHWMFSGKVNLPQQPVTTVVFIVCRPMMGIIWNNIARIGNQVGGVHYINIYCTLLAHHSVNQLQYLIVTVTTTSIYSGPQPETCAGGSFKGNVDLFLLHPFS